MQRAPELAVAWRRCLDDVAESCARHGRDPADVTVIAVTKGFPLSDVLALAAAGATDVGESRDAEGREKRQQAGGAQVRWHAIGQVQTNKARGVAAWADVVHSVDRPRLATALAQGVPAGTVLDVLVQVNVESLFGISASGRAGIPVEQVDDILEAVLALPQLALRGLMVVAHPEADPQAQFEAAAQVQQRLRTQHPGADMFSAGMSQDFDSAIAAGATHLRIGSAILGSRD